MNEYVQNDTLNFNTIEYLYSSKDTSQNKNTGLHFKFSH